MTTNSFGFQGGSGNSTPTGLTIGITAITSGTIGRILFEGTGNVLQESANLFWDNTNSRLGIGTSSPSAILHSVGSITASGSNARGNYMQPTLLASANNDVLVGLDISPTFTNGAFTSVTNMLLNMSSPSVSGASIFVNKYAFNNGWIINIKNGTTSQTGDIFQNYGLELGSSSTNVGGILKGKWGVGYSGGTSSVPVTLSVNGSVGIGITTDAGFKLDVNGTSRFSNAITLTDNSATILGSAQGITFSSAYWTDFSYGGSRVHRLASNAFGLNSYIGNNIAFGYNPTGSSPASAKIEIGAGTATAGTAPLKLRAGTNLTTPENGAFEFDGTNLYFTTGGVRKTINLI